MISDYISLDQLAELMNCQQTIRNLSIVSNQQQNYVKIKEKLWDQSFKINLNTANEFSKEQLPSTISDLYIYKNKNDKMHLINLINFQADSNTHLPQIIESFKVTEGALFIINEYTIELHSLFRQALFWKTKPIILFNNLNSIFANYEYDCEIYYQQLVKTIHALNSDIQLYAQEQAEAFIINPEDIIFGQSHYEPWAFTIESFAQIYSKKFGLIEDKIKQKLWGDHFYDDESQQWLLNNSNINGKILKRGFITLILNPMIIDQTILTEKFKVYGFHNCIDKQQLNGIQIFHKTISNWLNGLQSLFQTISVKIPSPKQSQKYKAKLLYTGPSNDLCFKSIYDCNQNGPLIMYISRLLPQQDEKFLAFGRIFSGQLSAKQQFRLLGQNYKPGSSSDSYTTQASKLYIFQDKYPLIIQNPIICGNFVALEGVDQFIQKSCTISSHQDCYILQPFKTQQGFIRCQIKPENVEDLPKMLNSLKILIKLDQNIEIIQNETGGIELLGKNQQHLEKSIERLEKISKLKYKKSNLFIPNYKETIISNSQKDCFAISQNKCVRLFAQAQQFTSDAFDLIQKGNCLTQAQGQNQIISILNEMDQQESPNIICFGPEQEDTNVLIDSTTGLQIQNSNFIKDILQGVWRWTTKEGVLCQQSQRGVRIDVREIQINLPDKYKTNNQIFMTARRLFYGTFLSAKPKLLEPEYVVIIECNIIYLELIIKSLERRGIQIFSIKYQFEDIVELKCQVSVSQSYGLDEEINQQTNNCVQIQYNLNQYGLVDGDPLQEESNSGKIILQLRKLKGLKIKLPQIEEYL